MYYIYGISTAVMIHVMSHHSMAVTLVDIYEPQPGSVYQVHTLLMLNPSWSAFTNSQLVSQLMTCYQAPRLLIMFAAHVHAQPEAIFARAFHDKNVNTLRCALTACLLQQVT